jgi:hypothetical protein
MTLFDLAALRQQNDAGIEGIELAEPEIPDVRYGTGPFNIINPLTGAYDSSTRPLSRDNKDDSAEKAEGMEDNTGEPSFTEEDGYEEAYEPFVPESFSKETCLPLLNLAQMLEILQRKSPGRNDIFFAASAGGKAFTLGKIPAEWESSGDTDEEEAEPCDVLWEAIKELL